MAAPNMLTQQQWRDILAAIGQVRIDTDIGKHLLVIESHADCILSCIQHGWTAFITCWQQTIASEVKLTRDQIAQVACLKILMAARNIREGHQHVSTMLRAHMSNNLYVDAFKNIMLDKHYVLAAIVGLYCTAVQLNEYGRLDIGKFMTKLSRDIDLGALPANFSLTEGMCTALGITATPAAGSSNEAGSSTDVQDKGQSAFPSEPMAMPDVATSPEESVAATFNYINKITQQPPTFEQYGLRTLYQGSLVPSHFNPQLMMDALVEVTGGGVKKLGLVNMKQAIKNVNQLAYPVLQAVLQDEPVMSMASYLRNVRNTLNSAHFHQVFSRAAKQGLESTTRLLVYYLATVGTYTVPCMKDAWWIRQLMFHAAQAEQQEGAVCAVNFQAVQRQASALTLSPVPASRQPESKDPPLSGGIANSMAEVQEGALWHRLQSVRPKLEALGLSVDTSEATRGFPNDMCEMAIRRDMSNVCQSTREQVLAKFAAEGFDVYNPNEDGSCTIGVAVQIAALITNFNPPLSADAWLAQQSEPKGIYSNISYAVRAMRSIHAWLERYGTGDGAISDEPTLSTFHRVITSWESQIPQATRHYALTEKNEMVPQDIATVFALQFNMRVTVVVADTSSCPRTKVKVNAAISMYEVPNAAVFPNIASLPLAPFAILAIMYRDEQHVTRSHAALIYDVHSE